MSQAVAIRQLHTGVPGLDAVLGGGLPEFSFNLIAGPPGCGKTTLAHQLMFALATSQRPALYFTVLGEPPLKMLRYQQQFAFFDPAALNATVRFVSLSDVASRGDFSALLARIATEVRTHQPGLVFVDSFRSAVQSGVGGASDPIGVVTAQAAPVQVFVQQLGVLVSSWQATTFLIGEYTSSAEANPMSAVADGLFMLSQSVQRNSMVRKLEVLKMRGQPTLPGLHTLRITRAGIEVFAPASSTMGRRVDAAAADERAAPAGAATAARPSRPRLCTGIARLDQMLGGGLPHGHSLLVAGPSGSGKSILAAAFLTEGARVGQTGVIAAFEQHPRRSGHRALIELIERGQVGVVDSRAPDLSIDEVVLLIAREVHRLKASRVVIDSLSGFELALAPTFRADFRESMSRMVSALAALGVSVLMTSELEDRYTDLRFSPYGTAFLTDAIIVQRYIELDSRLLRVMAVVKVRGSAHANELRQFTIDDQGIHVGDMLPKQVGLLGGQPTPRPDHAG